MVIKQHIYHLLCAKNCPKQLFSLTHNSHDSLKEMGAIYVPFMEASGLVEVPAATVKLGQASS